MAIDPISSGSSYRWEQLEKRAYAGLKVGERELEASRQTVARKSGFGPEALIDRIFTPGESNQRVAELEQRLPQLRYFKDEFEAAKKSGAPQAERDAKLMRFATAAAKTQGAVTGSLETENQGLVKAADDLQTAANVSATVRDTALTAAAALSTGGGSLALTAGVVAAGTVVKTASQESALRIQGRGRDLQGIAGATVRNAAGLTADAAGGYGSTALKLMARAGQIGTATSIGANAATNVAVGATKRAIDGKPVLDAKAAFSDALVGGTGALGEKLKGAGYLATQGGVAVAVGAARRAAAGEQVVDLKAMGVDAGTGVAMAAVNPRMFVGSKAFNRGQPVAAGLETSSAYNDIQKIAALKGARYLGAVGSPGKAEKWDIFAKRDGTLIANGNMMGTVTGKAGDRNWKLTTLGDGNNYGMSEAMRTAKATMPPAAYQKALQQYARDSHLTEGLVPKGLDDFLARH